MPDKSDIDELVRDTVLTADPGDPSRVHVQIPGRLVEEIRRSAQLTVIAALVAFVESNKFDDDQDPALDTPAQRLVRAYERYLAICK